MEFLTLYAEAGMVGVCGALLVFMVYQNVRTSRSQAEDIDSLRIHNEGQTKQIENIESIVLKFLDRWNRSDEASDRRHEDTMKEIADLTDKVSYLSGKMSSK